MRLLSRWSLRWQLLFLVSVAMLPALTIITYSGRERAKADLARTESLCANMVQSVSHEQQIITENTRQLLHTL